MQSTFFAGAGPQRKASEAAGARSPDVGIYQTEIKAMMYACGDVRSPDPRSSAYLEHIIHAQAKALLNKAHEVSRLRNSRSISIEDIVFVLRKDAYKIKKLSNYIFFKDVRKRIKSETVPIKSHSAHFLRYSWLPPLSHVDGDLEMTERLKLINELTGDMTREEYLDFTECRQASFTFRKSKKFKDFLCLDYRVKEDVIDVIGFVSYEMVFEIVSFASEIRMKKNHKQSRSRKIGGIFRAQLKKTPVTEGDIDEACRRIIAKRGTLY